MRNKLLLFLFIFSYSTPVYSELNSVFYLRADIKSSNGIIVENNLLIVPADNDFRIKKFDYYIISGNVKSNSKPDVLTAAKHNAFTNLLINKGVKSINNKSESKNWIHHDESVMSYEGYIKSAYKITSQAYHSNNSEFHIEMEISFAPLAYPSEWSFYYFKKKLYDSIHNMISVFK